MPDFQFVRDPADGRVYRLNADGSLGSYVTNPADVTGPVFSPAAGSPEADSIAQQLGRNAGPTAASRWGPGGPPPATTFPLTQQQTEGGPTAASRWGPGGAPPATTFPLTQQQIENPSPLSPAASPGPLATGSTVFPSVFPPASSGTTGIPVALTPDTAITPATGMPAWFQDWLTRAAAEHQQYLKDQQQQTQQSATQQQQIQQLITGQATANDLTAQNMKLMGGTEFAKIWLQAASLAADTAYRDKLIASNDVNAARTAGVESARITLENLARTRGMDIDEARNQVQAEIARGNLNLEQERLNFQQTSEQDKTGLARQLGLEDIAVRREQLAQQGLLERGAQGLEQQRITQAGVLGQGNLDIERQRLAQQGGFQQQQLGLEQAKFLAGLRGPGDAFTYMNMFRGQQPGDFPAFLRSIAQNKPMPGFGGENFGPTGPSLRTLFSQSLGPYQPTVTQPGWGLGGLPGPIAPPGSPKGMQSGGGNTPPDGFTPVEGTGLFESPDKNQMWMPG